MKITSENIQKLPLNKIVPSEIIAPISTTNREDIADFTRKIIDEIVLSTLKRIIRKENQLNITPFIVMSTLDNITRIDEYVKNFNENEKLMLKPSTHIHSCDEIEPVC